MADTPKELKVALSYLEDVQKEITRISTQDNVVYRGQLADQLRQGDLALALAEIRKAEAKGHDVSKILAGAYFYEGLLCLRVASGPGGNNQMYFEQWSRQAVNAFRRSIQVEPSPSAWFNLGLVYKELGHKSDALNAFREAEAGDDESIGVQASKEIGRITQSNSTPQTQIAASNDMSNGIQANKRTARWLQIIVWGCLGISIAWALLINS